MADGEIYVGLDVGTGGVRALAVNAAGDVLAEGRAALDASAVHSAGDRHEQEPEAWWAAAVEAIGRLLAGLRDRRLDPRSIAAVAIDGTSGTLVCLDHDGHPIGRALMYNDGRAADEADELDAAARSAGHTGARIGASFAIARARWIERHEPARFAATRRFAHQADFLAARLSAEPAVTDHTNALKTGYDLTADRWGDWLLDFPGLFERLPRVVPPGRIIGAVTRAAAGATGLPAGTPVASGATDGVAAFLASGATRPGELNTTLGTTLVFKALAELPCEDPNGLIYAHKLPGDGRLPAGYWLPGAAASTGGEWIGRWFGDADPAALDAAAAPLLPCDHIAYPLARTGERFPFQAPAAEAFCEPPAHDEATRYAANLQGAAFVERLSYERLDAATGAAADPPAPVYTTGGGSASDLWTQLRADVTGRVYHRPAIAESAFGAAVLAAAAARAEDLWPAIRRMVRITRTFHPDPRHADRYADLYNRFKAALRARGYVP